MLAAAMNPCPCGYAGDPAHGCRCDPIAVERYFGRVSGPLLDRIDIHLAVPAVPCTELTGEHLEEPSGSIRERVEAARERQRLRFADHPGLFANAHMASRELRKFCRLAEPVESLLRTAISRLGLSARAYHRVLKLARTIADLAGQAEIGVPHVSEAIQYRSLDRQQRKRLPLRRGA
jgi:magnesium chelatase family protein